MAGKHVLGDERPDDQPVATRAGADSESLRADIAHDVLEPRSNLCTQAMCTRYGVVASPLREALSQLAAGRHSRSRNANVEHLVLVHAAQEGQADDAVRWLGDHCAPTSDTVAAPAHAPGRTA